MKKPELLAPAGNLEKLKIALQYGADAVYVGGHVFGLRKYADNFSLSQLREGLDFAHERNKCVYVVLNGFAHNDDLNDIEAHLHELEELQPDALIISDMGVFQLAKEHTTIPLHVSTQASVTNRHGCQFWKDAGAKRVILAREVSVQDCVAIKSSVDTELEIFVHGAMCASYSGKCVISNYTSGRDSNRGGCVQSCRHTYEIKDTDTREIEDTTHIMNAKDLMGIRQLPDILKAEIESVKVEGRMKSNLYAANIARVYRRAIDAIYNILEQDPNATFSDDFFTPYEEDLKLVSNRSFSSGGLDDRPGGVSIAYDFDRYYKSVEYVGTVKQVHDQDALYVDVKSPFEPGDTLTLLQPDGTPFNFTAEAIESVLGMPVEKTNPNSFVKLNWPKSLEKAEELSVLCKPL
jgi:putative protease